MPRLEREPMYYRQVQCSHTPRLLGVCAGDRYVAVLLSDLGVAAIDVERAVCERRITTARLRRVTEQVVDHLHDHVYGRGSLGASEAERWELFVEDFVRRPRERLAELAGRASDGGPAGRPLLRSIERMLTLLRRVESSRARLAPALPDLVRITHGDCHFGNVMLTSGRDEGMCLIDPHGSRAGSPLYDLGKLAQTFTAGYAAAMRPACRTAAARANVVVRSAIEDRLKHYYDDDGTVALLSEAAAGIHLAAAAPHHTSVDGEAEALLRSGTRCATRAFARMDQRLAGA